MKKVKFDDSDIIKKSYLEKIFKNGTERICLHKDENEELHVMIIHKEQNDIPKIHMHPYKNEMCIMLEGTGILKFYDSNGNYEREIKLEPYNKDNNFVCNIPKGIWHTTIPITSIIYLECVRGPFDKSTHNEYLECI